MENSSVLCCNDCLKLMELIDPSERCPFCFSPEYCPSLRVCGECQKCAPVCDKVASAFDYIGPAASLTRHLKYGGQKHLARGLAAYMAAQFIRLDWPMPDVIVPVPMAWNRKIERGFNQSELLATHLSTYFHCPVVGALERTVGDFSQGSLSQGQRESFSGQTISLKEGMRFYDQTLLLIDDVFITGATLRKCAGQLFTAYPAHIYALTFCRSPF